MSLGVGLTNLAKLAQQEHDAHSSRGAHADGITPDLRQDEGARQSFIEKDVHETSFLSNLLKWIVLYGQDVSKSKLCNIFRINAALSTKEAPRYYLTGEDKVFLLITIENIIAAGVFPLVIWVLSLCLTHRAAGTGYCSLECKTSSYCTRTKWSHSNISGDTRKLCAEWLDELIWTVLMGSYNSFDGIIYYDIINRNDSNTELKHFTGTFQTGMQDKSFV